MKEIKGYIMFEPYKESGLYEVENTKMAGVIFGKLDFENFEEALQINIEDNKIDIDDLKRLFSSIIVDLGGEEK